MYQKLRFYPFFGTKISFLRTAIMAYCAFPKFFIWCQKKKNKYFSFFCIGKELEKVKVQII
jgi:hypothetical protein